MKKTVMLFLVSFLGWSGAQERVQPVLAESALTKALLGEAGKRSQTSAEPWIGVSIRKPGDALLAHLIGVPKGVGFTVSSIESTGPAATAGLQPQDYLWKLEDQLLVNEGQFIALLAMHKIGDKIRLTYQRQGKDIEAEVILVARPIAANGRSEVERILALNAPKGGTEISIQERFAMHEGEDGVVKVKRGSEKFYWIAWDSKGEQVGHGGLGLPDERGRMAFPKDLNPVLKNKLSALIRAYEHAAGRGSSMPRAPRVRRVPTPVDDFLRKRE